MAGNARCAVPLWLRCARNFSVKTQNRVFGCAVRSHAVRLASKPLLDSAEVLNCLAVPVREKSKRARGGHAKSAAAGEEEGEEWDSLDDDSDPGKDFKDLTKRVPSLRIEHVAKAAFGMSRAKFDNAFFASKIRVNGERLTKKAVQLHLSDELDVIRQVNAKNDKFLDVSRVVLRDVHVVKPEQDEDGEGGFNVRLRKFKLLVIENYPGDPWKETSA